MSSKPFRPCSLDLLISVLAPHFYNAQELALIKTFFQEQEPQQHLQHQEEASTSNTKPKPEKEIKVTPKRRREMHDEEERPTPSWASSVNRKPRTTKNAAPPSSSSSSSLPSLPTPSLPSPASPPSSPSPPVPASLPLPPPDLPDEFKNRITELNGSDIQFLMSKKLFKTDLTANHDRLSMPMKEIGCDFLTEAEKAILEERDCAGKLVGVEVKVLDPCLRECRLSLKKWKMRSTSIYCLTQNWKKVVTDNRLQKGYHLQIWSFRVYGKLYFALIKL